MTAGASWEGFEFLRFRLKKTRQLGGEEMQQALSMPMGEGLLHYKFMPATGEPWQEADAAYATLTPFKTEDGIEVKVKQMWFGDGELQFNRPTWEQMPTQNHIVEAFCNLDILEYQPAYVMVFEDNNDLRGQRRLK